MPKISANLLSELDKAIASSFADVIALRQFVDTFVKDNTGFNFDSKVPFNCTLEQARNSYFNYLNDNGLIQVFLFPYFQEYAKNILVAQFKNAFESEWGALTSATEALKFKKELFFCNFISNNKLLFINRENLKKFTHKLVNRQESPYLFINGEKGAGKSYTYLYLSHIAEMTKSFKLVKIDFSEIFKKAQGQIKLVDIGKEIQDNVPEFRDFVRSELGKDRQLDLKTDAKEADFKYTELKSLLWSFISKSTDIYMFFFDQFNNPYAGDVSDFIRDFVRGLLYGPIKNYYMVLSGFNNEEELEKLGFEAVQAAKIVKVGSFSDTQLTDFINALHDELSEEYEMEVSADDLMTEIRNKHPFNIPELFTNEEQSNVTIIGRALQTWLTDFREKIEEAD